MHLLPAVAIQSVDFSVKSLFMPDSSGAFIKAYLEMHALITVDSKNSKSRINTKSFRVNYERLRIH